MNTATKTVREIGLMSFTGNVIPHTWYQHITKETQHSAGKAGVKQIERPYLEAIVILSDIIYWYRPQVLRDEATGQVVAVNRRFKADKLQRSYQQLADMFGLGKDQARAAVKHLEDAGLIVTEFRSFVSQGVKLSNVLYIEPVPAEIAKINTPISLQTDTPQSIEAYLPSPQTDTNTENTLENSQKNQDAPVGAVSTDATTKADLELFHGGDVPETQTQQGPTEPPQLDVLTHTVQQARRREKETDWLLPGTPAGDHEYRRPFEIFCGVIQREASGVGEKRALSWLKQFETIANMPEVTVPPDILGQAVYAIRGEWGFEKKVWRDPYSDGFVGLVELTACQIMEGTHETQRTLEVRGRYQ